MDQQSSILNPNQRQKFQYLFYATKENPPSLLVWIGNTLEYNRGQSLSLTGNRTVHKKKLRGVQYKSTQLIVYQSMLIVRLG